jgi:hypothetical protein
MLKVLPMFTLIAVAALLAAGCGGSGSSDEEEEAATPAEAVEQIAAVRTALAKALTSYRAGAADAAEETVSDAYLEHFEHVEGPLGERDKELMEEIEEQLATDLRDDIKAGKRVAEIQASIRSINDDLDKAVTLLKA